MPLIFFLLLILGSVFRFIPHPANFTPLTAIAICGGLYFKNNKQAIVLPLLIRLASDYLIGFFNIYVMMSVYLATVIGSLLGMKVRQNKTLLSISMVAIISSCLFYLMTNTAVWVFEPYYSKSITGLGQSLIAGLPFFRNSLAGDLFYTYILVSLFELSINYKTLYNRFNQLLNKGGYGSTDTK